MSGGTLLKAKETLDPFLHNVIDVSKTNLHIQILFFKTYSWLCYSAEKLTFVLSLVTAISPQFTSLVMSGAAHALLPWYDYAEKILP